MFSLISRTNSSGKRLNWSIMNLNVKWAKHRNSVPRSHIDKPFTTREGVKQMKDVEECVRQSPVFGQTWASKRLPGY